MLNKLKNIDYRYYIGIAIVAIAIVFGALYLIRAPKTTEAAPWFNNDWTYRQAITATNNSNYDAINIPYLIIIDTATLISDSKMNSDGSDIRILNQNNDIIRYQIEESTLNTTTTGIWFEATVPADSSFIYHVYYGNSSASAYSFTSDIDSVVNDGETIEMKDGFGYSTSGSVGRISDIRKDSTNLGVDGHFRHTTSYPGNWWDDRTFARTLLASGPLFVEVQYEDTNYGNYSSFGTIIKMFDNGYAEKRVYMNYNTSGSEELYYYLRFDTDTRNSVWVNGSGTLIDQAENSGNLYQADLGDSWFGQRWTVSGHYGGTIVTENNSYSESCLPIRVSASS